MTKKIFLMITLAINLLLAIAASADLGSKRERMAGHPSKKFDRMDTDSSGAVSKQEFLTHSEKFFKKLDKNSDGEMSIEEIRSHKKRRHEGREERDEEGRDDSELDANEE